MIINVRIYSSKSVQKLHRYFLIDLMEKTGFIQMKNSWSKQFRALGMLKILLAFRAGKASSITVTTISSPSSNDFHVAEETVLILSEIFEILNSYALFNWPYVDSFPTKPCMMSPCMSKI